jgi:hypothetical protein
VGVVVTQLGDRRLIFVFVPRKYRYRSASVGKSKRDSLSDPSVAAGDRRDPAGVKSNSATFDMEEICPQLASSIILPSISR